MTIYGNRYEGKHAAKRLADAEGLDLSIRYANSPSRAAMSVIGDVSVTTNHTSEGEK